MTNLEKWKEKQIKRIQKMSVRECAKEMDLSDSVFTCNWCANKNKISKECIYNAPKGATWEEEEKLDKSRERSGGCRCGIKRFLVQEAKK